MFCHEALCRCLPLALVLACVTWAQAAPRAPVVPLWPGGAPGFESRKEEPEEAKDWWVRNVHNPSLTVFLPPPGEATGTGVVIAPGGGYRELVFEEEGSKAARFLNGLGVAAFVLKYRLPGQKGSPYSMLHPVQDARRAMRLVRARAAKWGVDPSRVGMLGFSAGGDLIGRIAYEPGAGDEKAADPIDRQDARPSFQMLVYPGGEVPTSVPAGSPPAFLLVGAEDEYGCQETTRKLYDVLRAAKVSVEAHFLARAKHSFNMGDRSKLAAVRGWPQRMADWLRDGGYLTAAR